MKFLEHRHLRVIARHNDFAALIISHIILFAESPQQTTAARAIARLGRSRFVVNTRMNNTTVMAGLMVGERAFLFEDD
jgi:hypothetical protein